MALWERGCSPEGLQYLPDEALCRKVRKGNQEAYLETARLCASFV